MLRFSSSEHANLLAVTQVFARLRYDTSDLLAIFGGYQAMIESPLIQEVLTEYLHELIFEFLKDRFGGVPADVATAVRAEQDESKLKALVKFASSCPDLDAFRARVQS